MFDETSKLGDMGEAVVKLGLEKIYSDIRQVPKDIKAQLEWGDLVCRGVKEIGLRSIRNEVKTEYKHTGNFFFETKSNVHIDRDGWIVTSPADVLYYLFWDLAIGYRIPMFQHVKWQFNYNRSIFTEKDQAKHEQHNLTRGALVPVDWVMGLHVGASRFKFPDLKEYVENKHG